MFATGGDRGAPISVRIGSIYSSGLSLGSDPPRGTLSLTPGATPATRAGVIFLQLLSYRKNGDDIPVEVLIYLARSSNLCQGLANSKTAQLPSELPYRGLERV